MKYWQKEITWSKLVAKFVIAALLQFFSKDLNEALSQAGIHAAVRPRVDGFVYLVRRCIGKKVLSISVIPEDISYLAPPRNSDRSNNCFRRIWLRDYCKTRAPTRIKPLEKIPHNGPFMLLLHRSPVYHRASKSTVTSRMLLHTNIPQCAGH